MAGRILNLKPWSDPVECIEPVRSCKRLAEKLRPLLDPVPAPAVIADLAAQTVGVLRDKAIVDGKRTPKFGFVVTRPRRRVMKICIIILALFATTVTPAVARSSYHHHHKA
jgi:hypothetical protein